MLCPCFCFPISQCLLRRARRQIAILCWLSGLHYMRGRPLFTIFLKIISSQRSSSVCVSCAVARRQILNSFVFCIWMQFAVKIKLHTRCDRRQNWKWHTASHGMAWHGMARDAHAIFSAFRSVMCGDIRFVCAKCASFFQLSSVQFRTQTTMKMTTAKRKYHKAFAVCVCRCVCVCAAHCAH